MIQEFGSHHAEKDHFVFWQIHDGNMILMVVYVDDIVITEDGTRGIDSLEKYLQEHFHFGPEAFLSSFDDD